MATTHRRALLLRGTILLILGAGFMLTASPVLAKGPSQAVLEGPGLPFPISLRAPGKPTIGRALATMVQESGFFSSLHGADAPWRHLRPDGELGPRYIVSYILRGGDDPRSIVQYLYPYAKAGPITYMPPGQRTWTHDKTTGGWHRADASLKEMLIELGLPEAPPNAKDTTNGNIADAPSFVSYVAILIVVIFSALITGWILRRALQLAS